MVKQKMRRGSLMGIAACTTCIIGMAIFAGESVATSAETQSITANIEISEDRLKARYAITTNEQETAELGMHPYFISDIDEDTEWGEGIELTEDAATVAW